MRGTQRVYTLILSMALFSVAIAGPPPLSYKLQKILDRAEQHFAADRYQAALKDFKRVAVDGGSGFAAFQVAWINHNSLGQTKDYSEAARWYTMAANSGIVEAMYNLYSLYSRGGHGLDQNQALAESWLKRGVEAGGEYSLVTMARQMRNGNDPDARQFEAFALVSEAASKDSALAHQVLGEFFEQGYGAPKNQKKATGSYVKCAALATEEWESSIQQVCARAAYKAYKEGHGVSPNIPLAYFWALVSIAGPDPIHSRPLRTLAKRLEAQISKDEAVFVQERASAWLSSRDKELRLLKLSEVASH